MQLVIDNKIITAPIIDILRRINRDCGKYSIIKEHTDYLMVQCPFHKDGKEQHPSCIVASSDEGMSQKGWHHCFACGVDMSLQDAIANCFGITKQQSEQWLIDNFFTGYYFSPVELLPEIKLDNYSAPQTLDEKVLEKFTYYHDYMWKRKLTKEIVDKYEVGYDPQTSQIIFPVRDETGQLVMITSRSIISKKFHIDKNIEKPVYLLYDMLRSDKKVVYVVESQINALYLNSLGYPAVALIGLGTQHQYNILRKSGIRSFVLMFDGDIHGRNGAERFKRALGDESFIIDIILPAGKDVNDLSAEEIKKLVDSSKEL